MLLQPECECFSSHVVYMYWCNPIRPEFSNCVFLVCLQLTSIQDENDSLQGKHSKYAEQLQNEDINLPNNLDVSFLVCLGVILVFHITDCEFEILNESYNISLGELCALFDHFVHMWPSLLRPSSTYL